MLAIKKGEKEEIRVMRKSFRGKEFVDIRLWYISLDDEFHPSKKGVTIPLTSWKEFVEIVNGIDIDKPACPVGTADREGGEETPF